MLAASFFLLALLPPADIQGTVRAASTGDPVPYATVRVVELRRSASTDANGAFVIRGVPDGRWRVQATAIGYRPTEAIVRAGGGRVVRVDFDLVAAPVPLAPVQVTGSWPSAAPAPGQVPGEPRAGGLDLRAVTGVPALAEPDVMRAVQTLPAVAAASDFSSALYVRGGSPDQTLVTLDGAPLFNPYHLGGLFGAVDPAMVASVDVLAGAFPARVGDRLSGVVDIRTRDGGRDRVRGSGALSLISLRAGVDGPLPSGRGSYAASVRRTYVDAFTGAAYALDLIPGAIPYAFADAHLKLTHDVGAGGVVSASVYVDGEEIDTPARLARETGSDVRSDWGSRLATVSYRRTLGPGLAGEARMGVSRFQGTFGAWEAEPGPEGPREPAPAARVLAGRTATRNLFAAAELTRHARRNRLRAGFQADAYRMRHRLDTDSSAFGDVLIPLERNVRPRTLAVYVDDEWAPGRALSVRGGVRVLHAGALGTAWMPRAAVRWAPRPALALSLAGGRSAQVMHSLRDEESVFSSLFAFDLLAAPPPGAGLLTGEDVVLGAEWTRGGTSVRVDAYARWLHGLPLPPAGTDPLKSPLLVPGEFRTGEGRTRGVELLARHVRGRSLLSLSYALAFADRRVDGVTFTPRFERRHTLDALALLPLGGRGELNARLGLATGQPYTPVAGVVQGYVYDPVTRQFIADGKVMLVLGRHNSARLPGYLRLDLGARRDYDRRWFGARTTLTPYVHVINVLNTRNVLFARPQTGPDSPAVLKYVLQIPFFPTLGVEWKF